MNTLYMLHVGCAFLSIAGFILRGYWMLTDNALLQQRVTRVLPHTIDTVLLGTAIAMLFAWRASPLELPWVLAKILALLLYIGLGMVALRFGCTRRVRATAYGLALACAAYILSVAFSKNPLGFWTLLAG